MFIVDHTDIRKVLNDFGIYSETKCISELQRYHYERYDPGSKEVRLIVKAEIKSGPPLVVRFKNEDDVTLEIIESQSRFADALKKNGILTPEQYQSNGSFARWYQIKGYDLTRLRPMICLISNPFNLWRLPLRGMKGCCFIKLSGNTIHIWRSCPR